MSAHPYSSSSLHHSHHRRRSNRAEPSQPILIPPQTMSSDSGLVSSLSSSSTLSDSAYFRHPQLFSCPPELFAAAYHHHSSLTPSQILTHVLMSSTVEGGEVSPPTPLSLCTSLPAPNQQYRYSDYPMDCSTPPASFNNNCVLLPVVLRQPFFTDYSQSKFDPIMAARMTKTTTAGSPRIATTPHSQSKVLVIQTEDAEEHFINSLRQSYNSSKDTSSVNTISPTQNLQDIEDSVEQHFQHSLRMSGTEETMELKRKKANSETSIQSTVHSPPNYLQQQQNEESARKPKQNWSIRYEQDKVTESARDQNLPR